jgi:hypothetical protein
LFAADRRRFSLGFYAAWIGLRPNNVGQSLPDTAEEDDQHTHCASLRDLAAPLSGMKTAAEALPQRSHVYLCKRRLLRGADSAFAHK